MHMASAQWFGMQVESGADASAGRAGSGNTALHYAALEGHPAVLRALLAAPRMSANRISAAGDTPLLFAASRGRLGAAALLAQAGADVGACNAAGMSPLLVAAAGGHADCLRLLLKLSQKDTALVTRADQHGHTPLHAAAEAGSAACVQLLLQAGANAFAVNVKGQTPLDVAAQHASGDCSRLLEAAQRRRTEDAEHAAKALAATAPAAAAVPKPGGKKAPTAPPDTVGSPIGTQAGDSSSGGSGSGSGGSSSASSTEGAITAATAGGAVGDALQSNATMAVDGSQGDEHRAEAGDSAPPGAATAGSQSSASMAPEAARQHSQEAMPAVESVVEAGAAWQRQRRRGRRRQPAAAAAAVGFHHPQQPLCSSEGALQPLWQPPTPPPQQQSTPAQPAALPPPQQPIAQPLASPAASRDAHSGDARRLPAAPHASAAGAGTPASEHASGGSMAAHAAAGSRVPDPAEWPTLGSAAAMMWQEEAEAALAASHPEAAELAVGIRHLAGAGIPQLSMAQLDLLEALHQSALAAIAARRLDLVRQQEAERHEEAMRLSGELGLQ